LAVRRLTNDQNWLKWLILMDESLPLCMVEHSGIEPLTSTLPGFIDSLLAVILKSRKPCVVRVLGVLYYFWLSLNSGHYR
jgi:hypothetical protein